MEQLLVDLEDTLKTPVALSKGEGYTSLTSYMAGELTCPDCKRTMRLRKSKKGRFFLGCTSYLDCDHEEAFLPDMVNAYFYFHSKYGKRCPVDNTSLDAWVGRFGLYICCNNKLKRHTYKPREI